MPGRLDLTLDLPIVFFERNSDEGPTTGFDLCTVSLPKSLLSGTVGEVPVGGTFHVTIPAVVVERSHPDLVTSSNETVREGKGLCTDQSSESAHPVIDLTSDLDEL